MATSGKPKQKNINKPKLGSAKSKEDIKVVKIDFNTWYRSLSFDNVYKMDENGNANGGSGDSETESDSDNTITWDDETHKKLDELDNLGQLEDYDGSSEGSFDDDSSVSSGDISDAIAEISTDDLQSGSSISYTSDNSSSNNHPYTHLKRPPGQLQGSHALGPRTNYLGGSPAQPRSQYTNLNVGGAAGTDGSGFAWKKYTIAAAGGEERAISDTQSEGGRGWGNYAVVDIPPTGSLQRPKPSQATITDLRGRRTAGLAVEDPHLKYYSDSEGYSSKPKNTADPPASSYMMRGQNGRSPGAFGLRRPLSGSSNASTASGISASSGERLANYRGSSNMATRQGVMKASSGSQTGADTSPEAYGPSTMERKKRAMQAKMSVQNGYQSADEGRSSTLGRKQRGDIKERLFGSKGNLNRPTTGPDGQLINSTIISNPHATYSKDRSNSLSKGSISPSSANYVNINYLSADYLNGRPVSATSPISGSPWLKSTPTSVANGAWPALSETESIESISSSASSSIQAQIQQARAHAYASKTILAQEKEGLVPQSIHRSDSFKSTQSERIYATPAQLEAEIHRTGSFSQMNGPSSPTGSQSSHASSRFTYPLSALSPTGNNALIRSNSQSNGMGAYSGYAVLSKINSTSHEDDMHGSSLSLVSSSSSVYSTAEEKQNHEIRKLRRELEGAQEKVLTLTSQLSTNSHVVAAFEQSLTNMTARLQTLTQTAEQKDTELNELRQTIEHLKTQSGQIRTTDPRQLRSGSVSNTSTLSREHSIGETPRLARHRSSDSMSSLNSLSSACSATSHQSSVNEESKKKAKQPDGKKKNWLRSSFSKAFSRHPKKNKHGSISDVEPDSQSLRSDCSVPNSPLLAGAHTVPATPTQGMRGSHTHSSQQSICSETSEKAVVELQQQLHEKDMKLTDIRLEALSSAHQLDQLRDTMNRMKTEMASLKADNQRLQKMVGPDASQDAAKAAASAIEKRLSIGDPGPALDLLLNDGPPREGRRITISVFLTHPPDSKSAESKHQILIGALSVSGKTKWDMLDASVKRSFKEYCVRIDPATNLGLNTESVYCYQIGEIVRSKEHNLPELLPCGYLVGENTNITVTLKDTLQNSVDSLAFETLIPKSIVQRYVSLLLEHKRIILCGPSGTGKTFLAQKLAEYLTIKAGKELTAGVIATFNVDHKSSKELRQYLANIADQCESTPVGELPSVIILDNLHHVGSLGEVFNGFLSVKYQKCPYIIGTMNQATCSTTNLQLHHNFRWVLCANHMEPVKGFLGRYLSRKLVESEVTNKAKKSDLVKIVEWMPKVWQHLNKFLETHSSSDVTIGPRLFLSCPMDVSGSQVWFTDLWNYSIVPYLLEAVREGLQLYGRRAPWEDPVDWVIETYPWPQQGNQESLLRLRPEDVGYDTQGSAPGSAKSTQGGAAQSDAEGDPLLNMLMRLQEAASYSSPQSADSDSTSLDSHSSGVQEFTTNSNVESTL